jgi:hypothetical protein
MFKVDGVSIEADTTIFDPYKLTAGGPTGNGCYVEGFARYDQEDLRDMNQVTRRGTNWHNMIGSGEDKSIEFSDGPYNCVAVKKPVQAGKAATFT